MPPVTWRPIGTGVRLLQSYLNAPEHPGKLRLVRCALKNIWGREILFKSDDGVAFGIEWNDYIGWQMLRTGTYEGLTLRRAQQILRHGGEFVDVGANAGLFTCCVGSRDNVRCTSIEANAEMIPRLIANIALNRVNAKVVNIAAAAGVGLVDMEICQHQNTGTTRVAALPRRGAGSDRWKVGSASLEEILRSCHVERVDLLKLDVEGFESQVLQGVDWHGARKPRNILLELTDYSARFPGGGRPELTEFLACKGYIGRSVTGQILSDELELAEDNAWFCLNGEKTP